MDKKRMDIDVDESADLAAAPADEVLAADVVDEDGEAAPLPKACELLADGRVKVPLRYPVTLAIKSGSEVRSETYSSLTLRRLTGADQMAVANTSAQMAANVMFARICGMREVVFAKLFERMDSSDILRLQEVLEYFLGGSRKTGR